ncbi:MAG: hypothetical protein CML66_15755 [Rhodobacteraceae bacterium]|nr:hypothetical protein [Paracoccaceae bacterium]
MRTVTGQGDLQGLWQRAWLKSPGSDPTLQDHTTRVFWAQAGALYADLRIPLKRDLPDAATCLADLDPPALRRLMAAEGFAGTITVEDDVCTWTREINWHGAPAGIDAGRVWFDETGALIEEGVQADYRELWERRTTAPLVAYRVTSGDLSGILVTSGTLFLLGLGRADAPSTATLFLDLDLDAGAIPDALPALFATEYAFGHWEDGRGIAELCTNPFREGQCVLERTPDGWLRHHADFDGSLRVTPLRT